HEEDVGSPPHVFKFAIDCLNRPSFIFEKLELGLTVSGGETLCGSLRYSKYGKSYERTTPGLTPVYVQKGDFVNFTCILLPLHVAATTHSENNYSGEVPLALKINPTGAKEEVEQLRFGSLTLGMESEDEPPWRACKKAVEDAYAWTLERVETKGNEHVLEWSSPPFLDQSRITDDFDQMTSEIVKGDFREVKREIPMLSTYLLKFSPEISAASADTVQDTDLSHLVLLEGKWLYDKSTLPNIYKENNYVQMTVNASALPKGTKNMDVTVKYLIETGKGPFFHTVQLPVVDAGVLPAATTSTTTAATTATTSTTEAPVTKGATTSTTSQAQASTTMAAVSDATTQRPTKDTTSTSLGPYTKWILAALFVAFVVLLASFFVRRQRLVAARDQEEGVELRNAS
ncbi:unnamed protein product, partial [Symbiodinium pilosum]